MLRIGGDTKAQRAFHPSERAKLGESVFFGEWISHGVPSVLAASLLDPCDFRLMPRRPLAGQGLQAQLEVLGHLADKRWWPAPLDFLKYYCSLNLGVKADAVINSLRQVCGVQGEESMTSTVQPYQLRLSHSCSRCRTP